MDLPQTIPLPDQYFWYILATLLAIILIRVINRYVNRTEKLLERVVNDVQGLKTESKLQLQRIVNVEGKVDDEKLSDEVANKIINKLRAITPR